MIYELYTVDGEYLWSVKSSFIYNKGDLIQVKDKDGAEEYNLLFLVERRTISMINGEVEKIKLFGKKLDCEVSE